ncbi:30S ribosomal protein S5 [Candidatus Mycoplasma haematohominis]|uniref:Small ribosomal subunit protein uS5 n=1 Tax=Candidatus Mycoplasma haematohominis TaxID=1494318 RepID=A0A478FV98_9MOLU|nr:30S ribosomal protein S5 [Candidatus Mycoplasma haemohominis]GCE63960.1 30S ribosomal protein S5 [Candidatus Mycoplasma haemohominis]
MEKRKTTHGGDAHHPGSRRKEKKGGFKKAYKTEFEEKVIKAKRISKTTKGGRQSRAWVLVVVGNKKGKVGFGIGKSKEFQDAIKKAVKRAMKDLVKVSMNSKRTIFHEYLGKHGASKVLVKPAKPGTGIIAGGAIKTVLELAGYTDIYSKNLGSNTAMNMIRATLKALQEQRSPSYISRLRDKTFEELFHLNESENEKQTNKE